MTTAQENKIKKLCDRVLDFYETKEGNIRVICKYGSKRFTQFYIGPRGGTTNQTVDVYKNWSKESGLTVRLFSENW